MSALRSLAALSLGVTALFSLYAHQFSLFWAYRQFSSLTPRFLTFCWAPQHFFLYMPRFATFAGRHSAFFSICPDLPLLLGATALFSLCAQICRFFRALQRFFLLYKKALPQVHLNAAPPFILHSFPPAALLQNLPLQNIVVPKIFPAPFQSPYRLRSVPPVSPIRRFHIYNR